MVGINRILAVNYHYLRPLDKDRYPNLHTCTPERFSSQLDEFLKHADPIDASTLEVFISGETFKGIPNDGFVLTFDDGLKDHYVYAATELERRGIQGWFFINTAVWQGELLSVHRLQLLNAAVPFNSLYAAFLSRLEAEGVSINMESVPRRAYKAAYRYDLETVAKFKYCVNYVLSQKQKDIILQNLFEMFLGPDDVWLDDLYMTPSEVVELHKAGHIIGAHSHRHSPLSLMSTAQRRSDLISNVSALTTALGTPPLWISYPNGVLDSGDGRVLEDCRRLGLKYGFTMNRAFVETSDGAQTINRVDTNDAPGGKSPIIGWSS